MILVKQELDNYIEAGRWISVYPPSPCRYTWRDKNADPVESNQAAVRAGLWPVDRTPPTSWPLPITATR